MVVSVAEVTALRAQLAELKAESLVQESEMRTRQRDEYDGLVQNLFQACYSLKRRLDEYR